ncbi:MAG: hypothetical protein GY801_53290 [bacterium]|nr:hypothetical protein [bacterium]
MECLRCNVSNPEGQKYCGNCGMNLDPTLGPLKDFLESNLQQEVQAVLKEQIKDQKVLEVETAQAIVSKLSDWAKLFAYCVGIPLTLLLIVLGVLGIKTYTDISKAADKAEKTITQRVSEVLQKSQKFNDESARLQEAQQKLQEQQVALTSQIAAIEAEFRTQIDTVETQVDELEKRVIRFESSSALTPEIQGRLESISSSYHQYLVKIGFKFDGDKIEVHIDPDLKDNSYYSPFENRLVMGPLWAEDVDVFAREYTHYALALQVDEASSLPYIWFSVESALADYFACSFSNDPMLAETFVSMYRKVYGEGIFTKPYIRDLSKDRSLDDVPPDDTHTTGEVLGGAFWEVRQLMGPGIVDKLLLSTWIALIPSYNGDDPITDFMRSFLEKAETVESGKYSDKIREIFEHRGVKL